MSILQYFTVTKKSRNFVHRHRLYQIDMVLSQTKCQQMLLQMPLKRVKLHENRRGHICTWDAQRREVGKKASAIGTADTLRYYAHRFPELKLTEHTDKLKMNTMILWRIFPKTKEKNLKNCLAKRNKTDYYCWDVQVREYIKCLRERGTAVNTTVVMASAEGNVKSKDANLLKGNGGFGGIEITKGWAQSLLTRMGMVKRKACSKNKVSPEHFDVEQFLLNRPLQLNSLFPITHRI